MEAPMSLRYIYGYHSFLVTSVDTVTYMQINSTGTDSMRGVLYKSYPVLTYDASSDGSYYVRYVPDPNKPWVVDQGELVFGTRSSSSAGSSKQWQLVFPERDYDSASLVQGGKSLVVYRSGGMWNRLAGPPTDIEIPPPPLDRELVINKTDSRIVDGESADVAVLLLPPHFNPFTFVLFIIR